MLHAEYDLDECRVESPSDTTSNEAAIQLSASNIDMPKRDGVVRSTSRSTNHDDGHPSEDIISSSTVPNCSSPPPVVIVLPPDAERSVREFSRVTALYMILSMSIGTVRDGEGLREEMRIVRKRAYDMARFNMNQIVPCILTCPSDSDDYKSLERIFFVYCSCLECLCEQFIRTYDLFSEFCLVLHPPSSTNVPTVSVYQASVNTGVTDPFPAMAHLRGLPGPGGGSQCGLSSRQNSILNLRVVGGNRKVSLQTPGPTIQDYHQEREDLEVLRREIQFIKDTIVEIHSSVRITPWAVQPDFKAVRYIRQQGEGLRPDNGDDDEDYVSDDVSEDSYKAPRVHQSAEVTVKQRRRRCMCLIFVLITSLLLFALVLGVCIALLKP